MKDAIKDQGWMVQGLAKTKTGAILTVKGSEEEVNRKLKEIPVIKEGKLTMREVKGYSKWFEESCGDSEFSYAGNTDRRIRIGGGDETRKLMILQA